MKIVILAEGDTERAAGAHLKRFLDSRAGDRPRVKLQVVPFDHGLNADEVNIRAEMHLRDAEALGVVALTDLHPGYRAPEEARQTIRSWMPSDDRCHVHVAKYDFEAWLLVNWDGVLRHAGVKHKKPWGARAEDIDGQLPPAKRLADLFAHEAKPPRRYKKPIDGKKLFEQLNLEEVAAQCPEFKEFINCLLKLAGYDPIS